MFKTRGATNFMLCGSAVSKAKNFGGVVVDALELIVHILCHKMTYVGIVWLCGKSFTFWDSFWNFQICDFCRELCPCA